MKKYIEVFSVIGFLILGAATGYAYTNQLYKEKDEIKAELPNDEDTITLTSVGNIIFHQSQIDGAKEGKSYDFSKSFEYVKDVLSDSDIAVGTLETVFAGGGNYSGFPLFNTPDEALGDIKNSGIDIVNYGHNHIVDKGIAAIKRTIELTEKQGLQYIGVRKDTSSKKYLISEADGVKIGFMSYVYETPTQKGKKTINSLPISKEIEGIVNTFNYKELSKLYEDMKNNMASMKRDGAQFIVLEIHWGNEYDTKPSQYQKDIAKKANELGVDLVLGAHPHVIQPCELIKGKTKNTLVTYSQGNFLSNQCYEELKNRLTEDGYILKINLKKGNEVKIQDYEIIPTWVYREEKEKGLFTHRVIPIDEAVKNKERFNLTDEAISRVKTSIADTEKILGEDTENVIKVID
ncbi:CapA family protein [Clostridium cadaveris]|uniref:CapA family protein n=1 Tax=Clostridium cadaveris TaxID=1529 RepID=UPI0015D5167D|nr:CapA family protein [Clostridium cadaveris]